MSVRWEFSDSADVARVLAALHRAAEAEDEDEDRVYLARGWRRIADDLSDALDASAAHVPALDPETGCCPLDAEHRALREQAQTARTRALDSARSALAALR